MNKFTVNICYTSVLQSNSLFVIIMSMLKGPGYIHAEHLNLLLKWLLICCDLSDKLFTQLPELGSCLWILCFLWWLTNTTVVEVMSSHSIKFFRRGTVYNSGCSLCLRKHIFIDKNLLISKIARLQVFPHDRQQANKCLVLNFAVVAISC